MTTIQTLEIVILSCVELTWLARSQNWPQVTNAHYVASQLMSFVDLVKEMLKHSWSSTHSINDHQLVGLELTKRLIFFRFNFAKRLTAVFDRSFTFPESLRLDMKNTFIFWRYTLNTLHTIIINNVNSCFIPGDCQWVVDLQHNSKRLSALKESVVHYGSAGAAWDQPVFGVKG